MHFSKVGTKRQTINEREGVCVVTRRGIKMQELQKWLSRSVFFLVRQA